MKYKNYYWEESKIFTLKEENRILEPCSYERITREVL